jgi:hypothetical protein
VRRRKRAGWRLFRHPDRDELYWNVTGNGWEFPIDAASVGIVLPADYQRNELEIGAWTGLKGSKGQDWRFGPITGRTISLETTRPRCERRSDDRSPLAGRGGSAPERGRLPRSRASRQLTFRGGGCRRLGNAPHVSRRLGRRRKRSKAGHDRATSDASRVVAGRRALSAANALRP